MWMRPFGSNAQPEFVSITRLTQEQGQNGGNIYVDVPEDGRYALVPKNADGVEILSSL
jgi:hypothetical protein